MSQPSTADTTLPDAGTPGGLPTPEFRAGQRIADRFLVIRRVAEGGMGVVYEVIDEKLNQRRALKCAKPGFSHLLSPEARHALRVTHVNVCRIFEIHTVQTTAGPIDFLAMEFIDGETLSARVRRDGPFSLHDALGVAQQIAAGVHAAHAQGVLHRDLKPNNILMATGAAGALRIVVSDFGLAQDQPPPAQARGAFRGSGVAGTPDYMAPERWLGAPASVASDVFALGVTLHEIVTGILPPERPDRSRAPAAHLPAPWRRVLGRCLAADPERRPTSALAVVEGLARGQSRRAKSTAADLRISRLAVLPFELRGVEPSLAAMCEGACFDLSDRLRRLHPRPPHFVVIPMETTLGVAGSGTAPVPTARHRLGATHVMRTTVTRSAQGLRIHSAIVDTSTSVALQASEREYADDLNALAPALVALVASALRLPNRSSRVEMSPEAYAPYAVGLRHLRSNSRAHADMIAALEQAVALAPASLAAGAALAEAYACVYDATRRREWVRQATAALARVEQTDADALEIRLAAGRLHAVDGAFDRAVREYRRATEIDDQSADAWRGLAHAYGKLGGLDEEAAHAYHKAIDVQPGYFAPLNDFAAFQRLRGNYGQAEALWRQAATLAPDDLATHANLGGLYCDLGRYRDAEASLRRALAIDAHSRPVLNNLGALYQYMGKDEDAVRQFEAAREAGPDTAILLLNLGDSCRRLGRSDEAAEAYAKGRELADALLMDNPRDAALRAFVAYFALRLGERAVAERELAQAIRLDPGARTVIRRAAICYEAMGLREAALAVLDSAPPDVISELSRQPDVRELCADARFTRLVHPEPA